MSRPSTTLSSDSDDPDDELLPHLVAPLRVCPIQTCTDLELVQPFSDSRSPQARASSDVESSSSSEEPEILEGDAEDLPQAKRHRLVVTVVQKIAPTPHQLVEVASRCQVVQHPIPVIVQVLKMLPSRNHSPLMTSVLIWMTTAKICILQLK